MHRYLLAGTFILISFFMGPAFAAEVVINQLYGGGGNTGATYRNDFIELYNNGSSAKDLSGWSVQYASATGLSWSKIDLAGSIAAHGFYLVKAASGGSVGIEVPTADATGGINMNATTGKLALVNSTTLLVGTTPFSGTTVVDAVGYGTTASNWEGFGRAPAPSNTTAIMRVVLGLDGDDNQLDFIARVPVAHNSMETGALSGSATTVPTPAYPGTDVTLTVTVEPVIEPPSTGISVSANLSSIGGSAAQSMVGSGNTFTVVATVAMETSLGLKTLNFSIADEQGRTATFSVPLMIESRFAVPLRIHNIQGSAHRSLHLGAVSNVPGIVTALRSNGFYLQDPLPDADEATSEGIFVFTSSAPVAVPGQSLLVSGTVIEFRAGGSGGTTNLTTTQISSPTLVVVSSGNALPEPVHLGAGGRPFPTAIISNDAAGGDVENAATVFDPSEDGIDFYESLESMRVSIEGATAVGPTGAFGEIPVLADFGATAGPRSARGGIILTETDGNPERLIIDDSIVAQPPQVSVGDAFPGTIIGVIDYSFGNVKLLNTAPLPVVLLHNMQREVTDLVGTDVALTVATYNVENLDPSDGTFPAHAATIVNNLNSPDIICLEEIQDNDGATGGTVVAADVTLQKLADAIITAGGPAYQFRSIDPVADQDGGQPGGNIRVVFFYRADRVSFVDRAGGTATGSTTVVATAQGPELSFSPGRIDPTNAAFAKSRKPLAGEFRFGSRKLFVIGNHFNSKGGDQPLFGRFQPPARSSEVQRVKQAQVVQNFVSSILAEDASARVVVLGDLNDFDWSPALVTLRGDSLFNLANLLPENERYDYVYEGNSQSLDHILVSSALLNAAQPSLDIVHVNAEFADQISDHDPLVARLALNHVPVVVAGADASVFTGQVFAGAGSISDPDQGEILSATVDYGDGSAIQPLVIAADGSLTLSHVFSTPGGRTVTITATDSFGLQAVDSLIVQVLAVEVSPPVLTHVGNPLIRGLVSRVGDDLRTVGYGTSLRGRLDQGTFFSQPLQGDGMITARLVSLQMSTSGFAGVTLRSSPAGDSAHVSIGLTGQRLLRVLARTRAGGQTATLASRTLTEVLPMWLRVARSGGVLTASSSVDGNVWQVEATLPTTTVLLGTAIEAGTFTSSGVRNRSTVALFSDFEARPTGTQ